MIYGIKSGNDLSEHFDGWLWEEAKLFPRGTLSMIIGHDGVGKTSITLELVADWIRNDEVVFLAMLEDGEEIVKSKLKAFDADLEMCVFQPDREDGFKDANWVIPDDLDKIEVYLRETSATVAVFDSLDAHLSCSPIGHKARVALAQVNNMAQRLKIPVIFLHHFNKGGTKTSLDQAIGGARGIKAAFRNILVWGDPFGGISFEGGSEEKATHALAVHKNSYGPNWPHRPTMIYSAYEVQNPYQEDETILKFKLLDSTPMVSPTDIYSARHQDQESVKENYVTGRDVASDAILKLLVDYGDWMEGSELEEKAIAAGACQRTVRGTRASMVRHGLIEKHKEGNGGGWFWRITERGKEHVAATV